MTENRHMIYISYTTEILEVNLFAIAYRLCHEDFSPLDEALCMKLPIEHSTTSDCRTNLNYIYISYYRISEVVVLCTLERDDEV